MKVKMLKNFLNKMGLNECKWSNLNVPGTETPAGVCILEPYQVNFPFSHSRSWHSKHQPANGAASRRLINFYPSSNVKVSWSFQIVAFSEWSKFTIYLAIYKFAGTPRDRRWRAAPSSRIPAMKSPSCPTTPSPPRATMTLIRLLRRSLPPPLLPTLFRFHRNAFGSDSASDRSSIEWSLITFY